MLQPLPPPSPSPPLWPWEWEKWSSGGGTEVKEDELMGTRNACPRMMRQQKIFARL